MKQAPYYVLPLIAEWKAADPNSEEARKLKLKIAANIGDEATLEKIFGEKRESQSGNVAKGLELNDVADWKELVKNKRYSEALEIIERGNLINPQKSVYFADQIRFLRKLVAIEKNKRNR